MTAKDRIEAEFSNRNESPDPNGSKKIEVSISDYGIEADDVLDIDYVKDVRPDTDNDEYVVIVQADSGVYFTST